MRDVGSSSSLVPLPLTVVPDTDLSVPISPFCYDISVATHEAEMSTMAPVWFPNFNSKPAFDIAETEQNLPFG